VEHRATPDDGLVLLGEEPHGDAAHAVGVGRHEHAVEQFLTDVYWDEPDFLVVDLPPGTGDIQLTLAQKVPVTGAVIVTTPQDIALLDARKGLKMFEKVGIPILGIVENMSGFSCSHCHEVTAVFKAGGGERLARELGVPFLGALPLDPEIMQSGDAGVPVLENTRDSHAARAILDVAQKVDQAVRHNPAEAAAAAYEPAQYGLDAQGHLRIDWKDGGHTDTSAFDLRVACGCASCVDENTGRPLLDPSRVPMDIAITGLSPVGRYALTASFSDGHSTGIYPYKRLKPASTSPAPSRAPEASFSV
jgi:ATP-binding protein involved in chromosome partitioning